MTSKRVNEFVCMYFVCVCNSVSTDVLWLLEMRKHDFVTYFQVLIITNNYVKSEKQPLNIQNEPKDVSTIHKSCPFDTLQT